MEKTTIAKETAEGNITSKIIRLSIYYFFVTLTYSSFSTVIIYLHQKYKHKGFGEAYLTANSLASIIIYMFCPFILSRVTITSNKLLTLCTMGYFINVLIPSIFALFDSADGKSPPSHFRFGFEILGNVLGGGASSIFMVLNGRYMTEICMNASEKGYYFGIANAIMNVRLVAAPLVTMLGLGLGNEAIYFMLLSGIILVSLPFPLVLIHAIKMNSSSSENNSAESFEEKPKSLCRNLISYLKYFKEFRYVIPSLILAGCMTGFISSSISHLLPKANKGQNNDNRLGFVLIWVGLGNVVAGYASGWLADKISIKVSSYIGHSVLAMNSLLIWFYLTQEYSLWGTCIIGFLSGYSYNHLFSLIILICTVHFKGTSESFSVSRQTTILSFISYQWLVAFLNNYCNMNFNMRYQSILMVIPAAFGMYCMKKSCDKYEKNKEQIENFSAIETQVSKSDNQMIEEE